MVRRFAFAALAALALAACGQGGSGPALPRLQDGARAPTVLERVTEGVEQATVSNDVREQLIAQMTEFLDYSAQQFGRGMSPPEGFEDEVAALQPGTDHRWVVNLTGGSSYMMLGVCDGDCTNVDIEVIDMETGGVVADDVLPDDFPVVNFAPQADGDYMVRIMLRQCSVAPCYVGARVLTGGGAPAAPGAAPGGDKPE